MPEEEVEVPYLPVRLCWRGYYLKQPIDRVAKWTNLDIQPDAEHPLGRKGLAIARLWQAAKGDCKGALFLDGDVAIDPIDHHQMDAAITKRPDAVNVAPVYLWPWATGFKTPVWAHSMNTNYNIDPDDTGDKIEHFSFCFTYVPAALIEDCIEHGGMEDWVYPNVDRGLRERRKALGTKVHLVQGAMPKHLNY